jgi:hypothetical protein
MARLNTTELDFNQIKENLKAYFTRSDSPFKDWNFDGSGLSVFIEALAYNTHYNAMLAHMTMNESFLDSAQLRANVVSRANLLGYVPASTRAPRATLEAVYPATDLSQATLILPRGTTFKTNFADKTYTFVSLAEAAATLDDTGNYRFNASSQNTISVAEGKLRKISYAVDNSATRQIFSIPDVNADTSTLSVVVRENASSTSGVKYTPFTDLNTVDANTLVYVLRETAAGQYELFFGDGVFGKKLDNLNVVDLEYVATAGAEANGATAFKATNPNVTVTALSNAAGGSARESIESVRFKAPRSLITQNRAVTSEDYINIILKEFPSFEAVNVWGGDQEENPNEVDIYGTQIHAGKVYISIKPLNAQFISQGEETAVKDRIDGRRVITTTLVFKDPDYVYVTLKVFFGFDSRASLLTYEELRDLVKATVIAFTDDNLQKFTGVFRHSNLLSAIDSASPAITYSSLILNIYKIFPNIGVAETGALMKYAAPLYGDYSYDDPNESTIYTEDSPLLASAAELDSPPVALYSLRAVRSLSTSDTDVYPVYICEKNVNNKYVIDTARPEPVGYVNIVGGDIEISPEAAIDIATLLGSSTSAADAEATALTAVIRSNGTSIGVKFYARPLGDTISPSRNIILSHDKSLLTVTGSLDTVLVNGTTGLLNFTTFPRD